MTAERGELTAALRGRLTADSLVGSLNPLLLPIERNGPREITIDGSRLTYCDGAGVGFFAEIRRTAARGGGIVEFRGLQSELQTLLNLSALADPSAPQLVPAPALGLVTRAGISTAHVVRETLAMISFLGELVAAVVWSLAHPAHLRWRDLVLAAEKVGVNAKSFSGVLNALLRR